MTPTPLDRLALALFDAGPEGLTRSAVNGVFDGHLAAEELDALLARLETAGAVRSVRVPTDGRPATRWVLVPQAPCFWTPDEAAGFWRAWLRAFDWRGQPQPSALVYACEAAGRRGVTPAHALEAVERYGRATPAPSIDGWRDVLKNALPVALADLAGE
jgi:hypothetical protein